MTPCPHCGASNAASAGWCTQCFAALGTAASAPAATGPPWPAGSAAPVAGGPRASTEGEATSDTDPTTVAGAAGIRRGPNGLEWVCVACETVNPIAASVCGVCTAPFTARFADVMGGPEVDWDDARTASFLAPGLGHLRARQGASGIARLVLFAVWGLGALGVLVSSGASGLPVSGPLLLGAVAIHVLTQRDLAALRAGRPQVLEGRVLLWLVVGVTALVLIGAVVGVGGAAIGGAGPPA